MPEHDTPDGLTEELRALPRRHRRAILNALTPDERARVASLLNATKINAAPAKDASPDQEFVDGYSTPIAARLRKVRVDAPASERRWKMTPAASRQLLVSAEELRDLDRSREKPVAPRSRSLLSAFGSWIASGSAVR